MIGIRLCGVLKNLHAALRQCAIALRFDAQLELHYLNAGRNLFCVGAGAIDIDTVDHAILIKVER